MKSLMALALMALSTYFVLRDLYFGISLIILIASSIYFGYAVKKGKGKKEVGEIPRPPNSFNDYVPRGFEVKGFRG